MQSEIQACFKQTHFTSERAGCLPTEANLTDGSSSSHRNPGTSTNLHISTFLTVRSAFFSDPISRDELQKKHLEVFWLAGCAGDCSAPGPVTNVLMQLLEDISPAPYLAYLRRKIKRSLPVGVLGSYAFIM